MLADPSKTNLVNVSGLVTDVEHGTGNANPYTRFYLACEKDNVGGEAPTYDTLIVQTWHRTNRQVGTMLPAITAALRTGVPPRVIVAVRWLPRLLSYLQMHGQPLMHWSTVPCTSRST